MDTHARKKPSICLLKRIQSRWPGHLAAFGRAQGRPVRLHGAGQVIYRLKHPFRGGTTHVLFSPEDVIARLADLVPVPGCNLPPYHGVLAPYSALRRAGCRQAPQTQ